MHTALKQATHGQPESESVAHQDLQSGAAAVGEHLGVIRLRGTEDLDDTGQQTIHAATHIHRIYSQPDLVDPNHLMSRCSQAAQSSEALIGQAMWAVMP